MIRPAIVAALLALAAPASAATFVVDTAHSSAEFAVRHLGISSVRGTIPIQKGLVTLDPAADVPTALTATLDLEGIDTHNERRDADLKSPNWFDAAKYPTMTFVSTKVEGTDAKGFKIDGNLTFHGVTKPVTLDVKLNGKTKNRQGRTVASYTATTKIDRHTWDLKSPSALSDAAVGSEIEISVETEIDEQ